MNNKLKALLAAASFAGIGAGAAVATAKSAKTKPAVKQVEISVTSDGFQPTEIKTKAGEPLRLVVTRKTDRTCAKELVIKDLGIDKPLPLNEPVTIDLTPKKDGQLRYACSMDMLSGVIVVE
jgi:plastocyanin domain-containing protein